MEVQSQEKLALMETDTLSSTKVPSQVLKKVPRFGERVRLRGQESQRRRVEEIEKDQYPDERILKLTSSEIEQMRQILIMQRRNIKSIITSEFSSSTSI
jgi:uncharacterized protein YaiL (DUF2058 family)